MFEGFAPFFSKYKWFIDSSVTLKKTLLCMFCYSHGKVPNVSLENNIILYLKSKKKKR